jgi:hypothetical protein
VATETTSGGICVFFIFLGIIRVYRGFATQCATKTT